MKQKAEQPKEMNGVYCKKKRMVHPAGAILSLFFLITPILHADIFNVKKVASPANDPVI